MTTPTFSNFIPAQSKKNELLQILTGPAREMTFGQFLTDVNADPAGAQYLSAFHDLSVEDVMSFVPGTKDKTSKAKSKEKKTEKTGAEIPGLKNGKDETERSAYKDQVYATIVEHGIGDGRGITPLAIRTKLNRGTPEQAKDALAALVAAEMIVGTGSTKGLRYVVTALGDQAKAKEKEEAAIRDAKKAKSETVE